MNTDRLTRLANLLDTVPEDHFDIMTFGRTTRCGTVACAVGWAGREASFQAEGFRSDVHSSAIYYQFSEILLVDWHAIEAFFDLDEDIAFDLFMYHGYPQAGATKPAEVAAKIRKLLKEGHA